MIRIPKKNPEKEDFKNNLSSDIVNLERINATTTDNDMEQVTAYLIRLAKKDQSYLDKDALS